MSPAFAANAGSPEQLARAHHSPRCNHVKPNGLRCGSPAMRHNPFCYFHHQYYEGSSENTFPPLEDGNSVQLALMMVIERLRRQAFRGGDVDVPVVKQLLYGLQTAVINLRNTNFDPVLEPAMTVPPWTEDRESGLLPPKKEPESEGAPEEEALPQAKQARRKKNAR